MAKQKPTNKPKWTNTKRHHKRDEQKMSEKSIAAGTKNLIPFTQMNPEVHKIISRNGGKVKSEAKTNASKWKAIKLQMQKKGMTKEQMDWMLERIENRDSMAADIIMYTEEIKNGLHPSQRVALANTLIAAGKFAHGEKIKTEAINVNINTSIEEFERRLYED